MIDRRSESRLAWVVAAGALARAILLAVTPIREALERRPELISPSTSYRSLKEGVFLHRHGFDPYAGGVFYHSPLYLLLFGKIVPITSVPWTAVLWILADVAAALTLVRIWRSKTAGAATASSQRDYLIALVYLFNPYTLATCVARSTTALDNLAVVCAIAGACRGAAIESMIFLSIATNTSIYPALLLLPLLLVIRKRSGATTTHLCGLALLFVASEAALVSTTQALYGSQSLKRSWGLILGVTDLTPNVGMWWYFFNEMFDHFRPFFRGVFQLHLLIYVVPLCLRLPDPLQVVLIMVGAIATWKSYPTLGDMALWAGLLSCFPELVKNLRHPLFSLTVHLYTSILLPLLHSLWLLTGSGNANFFYAATMVYGLNATLALADVLTAVISLDMKERLRGLLHPGARDVVIVQLNDLE